MESWSPIPHYTYWEKSSVDPHRIRNRKTGIIIIVKEPVTSGGSNEYGQEQEAA